MAPGVCVAMSAVTIIHCPFENSLTSRTDLASGGKAICRLITEWAPKPLAPALTIKCRSPNTTALTSRVSSRIRIANAYRDKLPLTVTVVRNIDWTI